VEVEVDSGTVEVLGGQGGEVARIRREAHWGWRRPSLAESVDGGVLRIRARCRGGFLFGCGVDYRVEVASEVSVRVRTDAGTVRVTEVSGGVDAESDAGTIRLSGVAGEVKARSDAGGIEGTDLRSTVVDAQTDAGGVRLSFAVTPDRVVAKSDAGGLDLVVPDAPYRVDADTDAGNVDIDVVQDPRAPRSINAETDAGTVRIRRGLAH
jgi:hypothetical protein